MPQQVKSLSSFSFEELVILEKFFESPWGQMTLRLEEKINAKAIVHYLAKSYSINRARLDCHARDSILVNIHTGINSQGWTMQTNADGETYMKKSRTWLSNEIFDQKYSKSLYRFVYISSTKKTITWTNLFIFKRLILNQQNYSNLNKMDSYSHVGDFRKVIILICWWQNHYVGGFLNLKNRSPTSQSCHHQELKRTR